MATGYEIISTTFTVDPSDPDVVPPPYSGWSAWKLVTMAAPSGKRWVSAAVSPQSPYGAPGVYPADIALNADGTECTAQIALDNDASGQPTETTKTVRVIAIDA